MIKLATTKSDLKPEDIAALVPANSGSYILYNFKHTYEKAEIGTVCKFF